ncbi:MAG: IMPACT family protein [Wenzhouxiangellaceae bacterium]
MTRIPSQTQHLEQLIKRSRFVARVMHLPSPEACSELLARHHDASASHHCWAYKCGALCRSNDDGEPGGSAGRPILAAITGQDFDQTLVVVQRWFGGIKLGVGGLVRAYGGSAAKCLQQTPSQPLITLARMRLQCRHEHIGIVHAACQAHQANVLSEDWLADQVIIEVELPRAQCAVLSQQLRDASSGLIQIGAAAAPPAG